MPDIRVLGHLVLVDQVGGAAQQRRREVQEPEHRNLIIRPKYEKKTVVGGVRAMARVR